MDIDIRKSITDNFKNISNQEINEIIELSIQKNDEITLPGLGVLFEVVWKHSNQGLKSSIVDIIQKNI